MIFQNASIVHVYLMQGLEKLLVGRLGLKNRKIFFEYNAEFIQTKLEISPFKLPLKLGVTTCQEQLFEGLFGVFNDSLPDGWGRLLLDRKLMKLGIHPGQLNPLDRLCYVGSCGMGALIYEPEILSPEASYHSDLDEIAQEVAEFQINDDDQFVDDLLALNGSSAGACPKILTRLNEEDWIIKFRSSIDPKDIGPIEFAYHLMAKKAHLDVAHAKLFPSKKGVGYFGAKRFDRNDGKHLHMHTISGLLHADYRIPSLDYESIMKATLWLTKDVKECEKQFRASIFNVLSHNRDDHGKNFSFLMNEKGQWQVSPAYDLTFSSGPGGEHCTTVMGEGRNPTLPHLLKLAAVGEINPQHALEMIDDVKNAILRWNECAQEAGVSRKSSAMIQKACDDILLKLK